MRAILASLSRRMLLRLPRIDDDLAFVLFFSLSGLDLSLWLLAKGVLAFAADPFVALALQ
jgi:hypothetical protein